MEKITNIIFRSFMAGSLIGIGCTIFLCCDNKYIGSVLFSFGLLSILKSEYFLFTGRIGGILKSRYKKYYPVMLLMNMIGTSFIALCIRNTRLFYKVHDNLIVIVNSKISDTYFSIFILSILCGVIMNEAVCGYKKTLSDVFVTISISLFILCGFEHCIANTFYFVLSGKFDVVRMTLMIIGNSIGGIISYEICNKR